MNNEMYLEISNDFIPFFSDIVIESTTGKWIADNSSMGYSAIKSYMEFSSRDEILTMTFPQVGIVLMIMSCDDGVLNWVFGMRENVDCYVDALNRVNK